MIVFVFAYILMIFSSADLFNLENNSISRKINNSDISNNQNMLTEDELEKASMIVKSRIVTDSNNINSVLEDNLLDFDSTIRSRIAESINRNKLDRNKFRDIFIVKKSTRYDGTKKVIKYDIDERIIPKNKKLLYKIVPDATTKILLFFIAILLLSLVSTTTIKLYENLVKINNINKKIVETTETMSI